MTMNNTQLHTTIRMTLTNDFEELKRNEQTQTPSGRNVCVVVEVSTVVHLGGSGVRGREGSGRKCLKSW